MTQRQLAAGVVFVPPLRAGDSPQIRNKILWVVSTPRGGEPLTITAQRADAVVQVLQPADSGPGDIYPTMVNVPVPGCWTLTLSWNGYADSVEMPFSAG